MIENLARFMNSSLDGVFIIGHSSALVRIDRKLILLDPLWGTFKPYGDYWTFLPEQIDCDEILPRVDLCFVSHIHEDHLCPDVLAKAECPVHIMTGRTNLFNKVTLSHQWVAQFKPFEWHSFADVVEFMFIPSAVNNIDSSIFLRNKKTGYTVYHGNDNFLPKATLEQIRPLVEGRVDVAMLPYAFIHWYPHLMRNMREDEKQSEVTRLNAEHLQHFDNFRSVLKPVAAIPFGSSLFYTAGPTHPLNFYLVTPFQTGVGESWNLQAGDYLIHRGERTRGMNVTQYLELRAKIPTVEQKQATVYAGMSHLSALRKRVQAAEYTIPHTVVINDFIINLERKSVEIGWGPFGEYTWFRLAPWEYREWIDGRMSFEEAIGTRRFTCEREPNVYNPKVFDWITRFL